MARKSIGKTTEWVGAIVPGPMIQNPRPYRAKLAVWMLFPQDQVLDVALSDFGQQLTLGSGLKKILSQNIPRPGQIRVPSRALADQIRPVAGGIPIQVAATPEIKRFVKGMLESSAAAGNIEEEEEAEDVPDFDKILKGKDFLAIHYLNQLIEVSLIEQLTGEKAAFCHELQDRSLEGDPGANLELLHYLYAPQPGGSPVQKFLRNYDLPEILRDWLSAQKKAIISIYHVDASPEKNALQLTDAFSGKKFTVREKKGSKSIRPGNWILCRLLAWRGIHLMTGCHHHALAAGQGQHLVDFCQKELDVNDWTWDKYRRDPDSIRELLDRWQATAESRPRLQNTAGESLQLTQDHFGYQSPNRDAIRHKLDSIPDMEKDKDGRWVYLENREETLFGMSGAVIATIRLEKKFLIVETNSVDRAGRMRGLLEAELGSLIAFKSRSYQSLLGPDGLPRPDL